MRTLSALPLLVGLAFVFLVPSAKADCPHGTKENHPHCGGGDSPATKIVFVTSAKYNGALDPDPNNCGDDIAGADCISQYHADQAGIAGIFLAWLSNFLSSPATDFVRHDGPYVRVDGVVVAANWDDLTDATLLSAIEVDENGNHPFPSDLDDRVWTATSWTGTPSVDPCGCGSPPGAGGHWCTSTTGLNGGYGTFTRIFPIPGGIVFGGWTEFDSINCGAQLRLYCFQQ